jgi:hypothetical protein
MGARRAAALIGRGDRLCRFVKRFVASIPAEGIALEMQPTKVSGNMPEPVLDLIEAGGAAAGLHIRRSGLARNRKVADFAATLLTVK